MKVNFKYLGEGRDGEVYLGFTRHDYTFPDGELGNGDIELELTADEIRFLYKRLSNLVGRSDQQCMIDDVKRDIAASQKRLPIGEKD